MDRFPVTTLQPLAWTLSPPWAPPMRPSSLSSPSPPPTTSEMSAKAKAFTIDALLGLHSMKDLPRSPPTSLFSVLQEDSHDTAPRDAPGKLKRHRTVFTDAQLQRLEEEFQRQQYLVGPERRHLAKELNLSVLQLKVWFQNRRIKWRKNQTITTLDRDSCTSPEEQ